MLRSQRQLLLLDMDSSVHWRLLSAQNRQRDVRGFSGHPAQFPLEGRFSQHLAEPVSERAG